MSFSFGSDVLVHNLLRATWAILQTDDAAWERLLPDLDAATRVKVRDLLRTQNPQIVLGYPRELGAYPIWAVFLNAERPEVQPIGLIGAPMDHPDEEHCILVSQTVDIWSVGRNATLIRVLHALAMGAVLAGRDAFLSSGIAGLVYTGSRDLMPMPQYLPEDLWARAQSWTFSGVIAAVATWDAAVLHPPALVGLDIEEVRPGVRGKVTVES